MYSPLSFQYNTDRQCIESNSCPLWVISNASRKLTWSGEKASSGCQMEGSVCSWASDRMQWHRETGGREQVARLTTHTYATLEQRPPWKPQSPFIQYPDAWSLSTMIWMTLFLLWFPCTHTWAAQCQFSFKESVPLYLAYLENTAMPPQKKLKFSQVKNTFSFPINRKLETLISYNDILQKMFWGWFWGVAFLCSPSRTGTHYIAQANPEFTAWRSLSSACWVRKALKNSIQDAHPCIKYNVSCLEIACLKAKRWLK